jgi:hypothetical protein
MLDTTHNRVTASTLKGFSGKLTDNITGNQPVLWKLGQLGGIVTRGGGSSIAESIILEDNQSVHWYSGADPLDTTTSELTFAEVAWKQLAGIASITGIEKFKNSSQPERIFDLWDGLGKQLAITMRRKTNEALFSDGSTDNSKALTGLLLAVENGDAWSTYAEINSDTTTNWRNQFVDVGDISGTVDAAKIATFKTGITQLVNLCTGGGDRPHLMVMTRTLMEFWEVNVLQAQEHYERVKSDEDMARAGFENFVFKGVPTLWDENMLPNTTGDDGQGIVALNLDYMKLVLGENFEYSFSDVIRPDNQDLESVQCLMYGNIVLSNRRRQGRADVHAT